MKPRKKGNLWEIAYRCPGFSKPITERFTTYEEAKLRNAEIDYERSIGKLRPPKVVPSHPKEPNKKFITVGELMDEYVQLYGLNHWGDSYLSYSRHRIEHYIKPYLGSVILRDLTTHDLDYFYDSLRDKPAVVLKGHKDTGKTVSPQVVEKVHSLLRSALNQAVAWGYIQTNPAVNANTPEYEEGKREVWTTAEAQMALSLCDDPILKLALLLAIGCSMRIGEILGLMWDHADLSEASIQAGNATIFINLELKRCDKKSLADLEKRGRSKVRFVFPEMKKRRPCKTSLVLKSPKTDSSIRTVYIPETIAAALLKHKAEQDEAKAFLGEAYTDYGLVLAHEDGRPYEERQIADLLRKFIEENELPSVVFHSLRHCSTSVKLRASGGNIKAVQGDTGHAQARMVTDIYSHIEDEDRKKLAHKIEQDFFKKVKGHEDEKTADDEAQRAYQLLTNNPEIAKLIIATLGHATSA